MPWSARLPSRTAHEPLASRLNAACSSHQSTRCPALPAPLNRGSQR